MSTVNFSFSGVRSLAAAEALLMILKHEDIAARQGVGAEGSSVVSIDEHDFERTQEILRQWHEATGTILAELHWIEINRDSEKRR